MEQHDDVLIALRRIIRATDLYSKHLSKVSGLTAPQLLVLQYLNRLGEMTASELANHVSLSQATMTNILDRLEKRGYVERERGESDKRKVFLRITEAGRARIANAPAPLQENFIRQFRALADWEQSMILSSLQRIAEMMNAGDIDASPVLDIGQLDRHAESAGQPSE